jgi:HK97 family phage prohead protease
MKATIFNKLELKDFEEAKGVVSFYYSSFNNVDLGGDLVKPGFSKKSVKENEAHIFHDLDHIKAVGKPFDFGEDTKGAFCSSKLAIKTIDGADCFEQYKAGIIKGHSMAYQAVKWSYDEVKDIRTITEAILWGVTSVTNIPMNLNTPTISLKSFSEVRYSMEEIEKFLRKGNISEKCGKQFIEEYNKLSTLAKSLKETLKADGVTFIDDEPIENKSQMNIHDIDFKYLTNNFNL